MFAAYLVICLVDDQLLHSCDVFLERSLFGCPFLVGVVDIHADFLEKKLDLLTDICRDLLLLRDELVDGSPGFELKIRTAKSKAYIFIVVVERRQNLIFFGHDIRQIANLDGQHSKKIVPRIWRVRCQNRSFQTGSSSE